jgi:hypothetical protein
VLRPYVRRLKFEAVWERVFRTYGADDCPACLPSPCGLG